MTAARRADPELDLDYSEKQGFLTGKAAAMADWFHRKDKATFDRYCAVLRQRRWAKANPERVRANNRKADQKKYARRREYRAWLMRGHVLTCDYCETQWCRIPVRYMGPEPKYCCADHGKRARYARDVVNAEWRAKNVTRVLEWQRANPDKVRAKARRYTAKRRQSLRVIEEGTNQ